MDLEKHTLGEGESVFEKRNLYSEDSEEIERLRQKFVSEDLRRFHIKNSSFPHAWEFELPISPLQGKNLAWQKKNTFWAGKKVQGKTCVKLFFGNSGEDYEGGTRWGGDVGGTRSPRSLAQRTNLITNQMLTAERCLSKKPDIFGLQVDLSKHPTKTTGARRIQEQFNDSLNVYLQYLNIPKNS